MHLKVRVDGHGHYQWAMVASRDNDQQPVAVGACALEDAASCERAAMQLLSAHASAMMALQQPDGRWKWVVNGPDGGRLAESATLFGNAAACGYALHELREALAGQIRLGRFNSEASSASAAR